MHKGDYQVIEIERDDLSLYQWDGRAWRYQRIHFATADEERAFVTAGGLVLIEQGTIGVWPMRLYRSH